MGSEFYGSCTTHFHQNMFDLIFISICSMKAGDNLRKFGIIIHHELKMIARCWVGGDGGGGSTSICNFRGMFLVKDI